MIATVDSPSNAAEWALAEMVNRLVSLLSVLPQLKFWASYATALVDARETVNDDSDCSNFVITTKTKL